MTQEHLDQLQIGSVLKFTADSKAWVLIGIIIDVWENQSMYLILWSSNGDSGFLDHDSRYTLSDPGHELVCP